MNDEYRGLRRHIGKYLGVQVVESNAPRGALLSLGHLRPFRFPSVLLQPLGHLSVFLESTVYGRVDEPETSNCVRPPNVVRSVTGGFGGTAYLNRIGRLALVRRALPE
jgi:hypothetical protein